MQQRIVRDFYKNLNQVNAEEIPNGLKLPGSFNLLLSDLKNNRYDTKTFGFILKGTVCISQLFHHAFSFFAY
ncbi:hypothetical protein RND81_09G068200 [Saponaria officinalis]|uniref:Uncharacterized protein n=1 Tax=Saponaria officinalis TaxID=3572 RepID=A0AAW1IIG8_SAPOF